MCKRIFIHPHYWVKTVKSEPKGSLGGVQRVMTNMETYCPQAAPPVPVFVVETTPLPVTT